jgi:hypothetical protein
MLTYILQHLRMHSQPTLQQDGGQLDQDACFGYIFSTASPMFTKMSSELIEFLNSLHKIVMTHISH